MLEWLKERAHKVVEGFTSKTGEKIADGVFHKGGSLFYSHSKLKHLEQSIQSLNNLAEDTENEVKNLEFKGGKKRKREVQEWLTAKNKIQEDFGELETKMKENKLTHLIWGVDDVEKLSKRVKIHIEDRKHFGELVLDHHEGSNVKFPCKMYGRGFRTTLQNIVACLKDRNVKMIGIHGAEKAGKTNLAKHIYNEVIEETRVYWVAVSANPSINSLQEDISSAIGLNLLDVNDVDKRAARLHHALKQRKDFVLILDDLQAYVDLQAVGCVVNEGCCKLIITTRSWRVVCQRQHVDPKRPFELLMDENEAWNIFMEAFEAFGSDRIFPQHMEEIFREGVNNRRGFPQRIIKYAREPEAEDSDSSD